jgi:hypothetical protein
MTATLTPPATPNAPPVPGRPTGQSTRQRQLPWIGAGLLLIITSTLGFALWTTSQNQRTPILIATADLAAGTVLTAQHVDIATVNADPGVTLPTRDEFEAMIGATLHTDIAAGTLLTSSYLSATDTAIPDGHRLVGVTLLPGGYPATDLVAGDTVDIVSTSPTSDDGPTITIATIWATEPLVGTSEPRRFITLLLPEAHAATVADVANGGGLRLIQRPGADQ